MNFVKYNIERIIIPDPTIMSGFPSVTAEVKFSPRYSMSHCQLTNLCCWVYNTQEVEDKNHRQKLLCTWQLTCWSHTWEAVPSINLHTWMAILERTADVSWWMTWAFRLPVLSISPTITGNDWGGCQNTHLSAFKSCRMESYHSYLKIAQFNKIDCVIWICKSWAVYIHLGKAKNKKSQTEICFHLWSLTNWWSNKSIWIH